ncbi:MAG: hypothetical protein JW780_03490 [Clostridiales bacterium]|nr:hypothetical protein [Clostridiales bacterium]
MNREFFLKMAEAKRMERDAILSLFPERSREHVETIGKEVREMIKESGREHQDELLEFLKILMECHGIFTADDPADTKKKAGGSETAKKTETTKKTRKVDIT